MGSSTYREHEPRSTDLETAGIHDIVARMKRLRRRVALPLLLAASLLAWLGMSAHAFGYWSVLGASSDGFYGVSGATLALAGVICAAPVMGIGLPLYIALRARLRSAWREEYRSKRTCDAWTDREEWLEQTPRRFS
jgi:hypothetical protein